MALILLSGKINILKSVVFFKLISLSGQGYTGPNTIGCILLFYLVIVADLMTDTLYVCIICTSNSGHCPTEYLHNEATIGTNLQRIR